MVWLNPDHRSRVDADGEPEESLRVELVATLQRLAAEGSGSSQRVERLLVLTEPPQLDADELTDKGYINQAAVRDRSRPRRHAHRRSATASGHCANSALIQGALATDVRQGQ
jgi:hypothetical protein